MNINSSKINKRALTQWIIKVFNELKQEKQLQEVLSRTDIGKKLILAFVDEQTIKNLNQKFRKKNDVTNILSFAPVEEDSFGELVLCLPVIERGKPAWFSNQDWMFYLVLHGILHLLGFEHESGSDSAKKMYALQDKIFEKII